MTDKADVLRGRDVRDAYRLIGECRDLGGEPLLWQRRMFGGLARLFGGTAATGGEGRLAGDGTVVPLTSVDVDFPAIDLGNYQSYMRAGGPAIDPFVRALRPTPGTAMARRRRQVVADRVYHASLVVDRYLRPGNVHHRLASVAATADGGAMSLLHLHRPPGDRDFSSREQALLEFFHRELAPLVGRALVSAAEQTPKGLSPRLRQTLACLIEGDSEKQVAARLGISQTTAHQYVTALYRRFAVSSRGQLLAHVVRRLAHADWKDVTRD